MIAIRPTVCVAVSWLPATNTKPARRCVRIRDYPARFYSEHSAPNEIESQDAAQWFAERRIAELGLAWRVTGHIRFADAEIFNVDQQPELTDRSIRNLKV